MKWFAAFVALTLTAAIVPGHGQTFPNVAPPVKPEPPPPPPSTNDVPVLDHNVWYVIEHTADCIVLSSPPGLVSITPEAGPLRIRGRFFEDPTKVKTKTFRGPFCWTVDAVAKGRVEIIVWPVGAKTETEVKRRTIDVLGARPPPAPVTVAVPNVVGKPYADAYVMLGLAGLTSTETRETNPATLGSVIRQAPLPGAQVAKGSAVALVVSTGEVVPPPELSAMAKQVKGWTEAVNSPTRKAEASALAKSFRSGQSAARAGAFGEDLAAMSGSIREANRAALSLEARAAWTPPFFVPLSGALEGAIKTVKQYADVCGEIAIGLEASAQ